MNMQKVYVKTRAEFGKQCIFDMSTPSLDVNIMPNPNDMDQYIRRTHCHVGVQHSKKYALHEVQLSCASTKVSGMGHIEGGWPKEINPKDEEATMRFRRRTEKDEQWAPKLRNLFEVMQHTILQNGTVNIYENYFHDMIPTELVQPVGLRTVNMYRDPETPKRPVTNISWSPDSGRRMAVSYCFLDSARQMNYSNAVFIWEVDNSNEPFFRLEPLVPCVTIEFNPRDPSVLASGHINGQVCCWDTRTSKKPTESSHLLYSHRDCANAVKWLPTKSNTEFFTTSMDGCAMWWDTRQLRQPTEVLMFDLENPNQPHMDRAIGVSCLNFGPMVGTKFMFGLENGYILTGSRKAKTNAEKLSARFEAHIGRVNSVDRSLHNPAVFMSVGDWRARIWAEDTREGCLVSTPFLKNYPTGGCWNKHRLSVFYLTTNTGQLLAWDILQTLQNPVFTLQLCHQALSCIAPCEEAVCVATGNIVGQVFLIEPTDFFVSFDKSERALLSEYLERCSRQTKAVDARLREIKLVQRVVQPKEETPIVSGAKSKNQRKLNEDKRKKGKNTKGGRTKDKKKFRDELPEVLLAEAKYFEAVQKGLEEYASETDASIIPTLQHQSMVKKPDKKHVSSKSKTKDGGEAQGTVKTRQSRQTSIKFKVDNVEQGEKKVMKKLEILDASSTPTHVSIAPAPSIEPEIRVETTRKKPKTKITFKLPIPCEGEVCKPKVCCWGPGSKSRRKEKPSQKSAKEASSGFVESTRLSPKLQREQSRLLKEIREPPPELKEEVAMALTEVRISNWLMGRRKQQQTVQPQPETKKKQVRSRKTLPKPTVTIVEGKTEGQSSKKKGTVARRKGINQRTVQDPCSPPKEKPTQDKIAELLDIPPLDLSETRVIGTRYIDEYETVRKRVYPRISEFHLIN